MIEYSTDTDFLVIHGKTHDWEYSEDLFPSNNSHSLEKSEYRCKNCGIDGHKAGDEDIIPKWWTDAYCTCDEIIIRDIIE
jgi:hypothetical protein